MVKVAFVGSFAQRLVEPVRARLPSGCDIVVGEEDSIIASLADAIVLVTMGFSARMAEAAPQLRLLQVPGAGLDRIERAALRPGTHLANAYGHESGIAEYAIGAMIALSRSFAPLDAALRAGRWDSQWAVGTPAPAPWCELGGRTLGVLGLGHIGGALARRAAAFDMRVIAMRRNATLSPPPGVASVVGPDALDAVLAQADFLAITLPLAVATRGLLDRRRLALMPPTAFLINVARAEIVDEAALYEALAGGRLAGAALDVWYRYPRSDAPTPPAALPFHTLPNVLMTPHVAGWTDRMLDARAGLIAENIARTLRGEAPLNAIPPAPWGTA